MCTVHGLVCYVISVDVGTGGGGACMCMWVCWCRGMCIKVECGATQAYHIDVCTGVRVYKCTHFWCGEEMHMYGLHLCVLVYKKAHAWCADVYVDVSV